MCRRMAAAVTLASATGMKLRGFHSNNSSSTASSTAESGAANVADIPAAAPATSSVLRSALLRWKNWAIMEPNAPPVMMIGPSAPNGPPEPIEIADEMIGERQHKRELVALQLRSHAEKACVRNARQGRRDLLLRAHASPLRLYGARLTCGSIMNAAAACAIGSSGDSS